MWKYWIHIFIYIRARKERKRRRDSPEKALWSLLNPRVIQLAYFLVRKRGIGGRMKGIFSEPITA